MNRTVIVSSTALSCMLSGVRAQGLMDIGRNPLNEVRLPFSLSVSSAAGWDSNPRAGSSNNRFPGLPLDGPGSAYWQHSFTFHWPLGHGRSRFNVDVDYSNTWYLDPPAGTEEFQNTGGLSLDYFRQINQRFYIADSLHFSHETEPDYQVGNTISRPTSGYFSAFNTLTAMFKWSTRFSAATSYEFSNIVYDEEVLESENHQRHTISEKLRYSLTQRTTATFDYRYSFSEYPDNPRAESDSHYVLLGVERPLSRLFSMSLSGGAEFRSYDSALGSETSPYWEGAINCHARENTTLRMYFRGGLEDTGSAGRQSRYTQRLGVGLTQRLAPGLSLSIDLDNVNSDFSGNPSGLNSPDEDTFHAGAGLNYSRHLWRRFNMNAGYSFSMVASDDELEDYERHRFSLGISAVF